MTLRCAVCGTDVYRVKQSIPADMDAEPGPVDWVEDELLEDREGRIELNAGQCLDAKAIERAEKSAVYSPLFHIIVPAHNPAEAEQQILPPPSSLPSPPPGPSDISLKLPPLFAPAPFSPSHPVFAHLASVAAERSQALRDDAEAKLARMAAELRAEVSRDETALRREVEALWLSFNKSLTDVTPAPKAPVAASAPSPERRSPIREREAGFAPTPRVASPITPSTPQRHQSALSASLSTSAFHHPRASASGFSTAKVPHARSVSSPGSTGLLEHTFVDTEAVLRGSFRRNLDQDQDIAASFKYTLDLGAEIAARNEASRQQSQSSSPPPMPPSRQTVAKSPPPKRARTQEPPTPEGKNTSPKSKGKRKVTFAEGASAEEISKPEKPPHTNGNGVAVRSLDDEIIFDLEDETEDSSPRPPATLALNEPPTPHLPQRPHPQKRSSSGGLPESFSRLRPASLPAPSPLRASPHTPTVPLAMSPVTDTPRSSINGAPNTVGARDVAVTNGRKPDSNSNSSTHFTPREEELARLVAAGTPSHRAAWRKDGAAWSVFSGRRRADDAERDVLSGSSEDENEGDDMLGALPRRIPSRSASDTHTGPAIAASLPIAIGPIRPVTTRARAGGDGMTYAPKTSLGNRYGELVPPLIARREAYDERDRARGMDPGALDFVLGNDPLNADVDADSDLEGGVGEGREASRGRQNALRILKARSELPSEGMWRSLAS
ncbi:hypothetical protein PENSPDRAFT_646663 [Peniophora sp. CONT]|nr:hypothetical protein PENSPDRAFT_646663 [Peniophora sp. CONT]